MLSLDSDVKLTDYSMRKLASRSLDKAGVLTQAIISATETGAPPPDEQKELREIVAKMNDLFSGDIREAGFVAAVAAWQEYLMANGSVAEQAKNNSEESFSMGDSRRPHGRRRRCQGRIE